MSERMAKVEGILEQMSERLNHVESRMDAEFKAIRAEMTSEFRALRGEMSSIRAEVNSVRAEMNSHFRWTVALIMSMWVTVIAAILFK